MLLVDYECKESVYIHIEYLMKYHESKLSYSMYLLHPMLMQIAYGNQFVVPVHFSDFKPVLMYFGEYFLD